MRHRSTAGFSKDHARDKILFIGDLNFTLIKQFRNNASGATAVEFALVSFPMLLTILFLMMIGYTIFLKEGIEFSAQKVARQIRIGAVQSQGLTQSQFLTQLVCPSLPFSVTCSNVVVNVYNIPYTANNF